MATESTEEKLEQLNRGDAEKSKIQRESNNDLRITIHGFQGHLHGHRLPASFRHTSRISSTCSVGIIPGHTVSFF